MARLKRNKDRPFPWRCGSCDKKEVYRTPTPYQATIKYEGRPYDVEISDLELPKCRECGEVVFDNHAGHQINQALRKQLGLLLPDQIRTGRTKLGLNQGDFAAQLGVAKESVSRWETGALTQSRVVDRQIRLFFEFPAVRETLSQLQQGDVFGETANIESSEPSLADTLGSVTTLEDAPAAPGRPLQEQPQDILILDAIRKSWYKNEPFWNVMAKYASMAPSEELNWTAKLFSSFVRRSGALKHKRLFVTYIDPQSSAAEPISQRLERLVQSLEDVPERDVPPLLDNFSSLLELWKTRETPAGAIRSTSSLEASGRET